MVFKVIRKPGGGVPIYSILNVETGRIEATDMTRDSAEIMMKKLEERKRREGVSKAHEGIRASYGQFEMAREKIGEKRELLQRLNQLTGKESPDELSYFANLIEKKYEEYYPHNILGKVDRSKLAPEDQQLGVVLPSALSSIRTILGRRPPPPPPKPVFPPELPLSEETHLEKLGREFGLLRPDHLAYRHKYEMRHHEEAMRPRAPAQVYPRSEADFFPGYAPRVENLLQTGLAHVLSKRGEATTLKDSWIYRD